MNIANPSQDIAELFNEQPTLETERLILRKLRQEDAPDMFEYASDPETVQYVTFEPNKTLEDTRALIERMAATRPGMERLIWAIEHKENSKMLGTVGLHLDSARHARAELAYIINKAYWGRGIVPEAAQRVIQYGFEALQLHRIQALCKPENMASARVMEKVGMSYEGIMREYIFIKGTWWDSKMYAILRQDWEAAGSRRVGRP